MKKQTRGRAPAKSGPPPTPRQMEVYRLVLKFFAEHGYPPAFADVAELDGSPTPASMGAMIHTLARKGLVVLPGGGRRARGIEVPQLRDAMKALAAKLEQKARTMRTRERRTGRKIKPGEPPTARQAA